MAQLSNRETIDTVNRFTNGQGGQSLTTSRAAPVAGVNAGVSDSQVAKGGIEGLFGGKQDTIQYTANNSGPIGEKQKAQIDRNQRDIAGRPIQQMQGVRYSPVATSTAASLNTTQADQTRARQNALLDSLAGTVAGSAPSAAQATLQQATDKNLAASLAGAAAAGNSPAAQRAAAFQRAQITQDSAAQSAALRANEIATAQGQLANAAQGVRGQDLEVSGQNAGLQQQTALANQAATNANSQFNANLAADVSKTNLLSGVEQQKSKDDFIKQYIAMGYSIDQANQAAEIQQRQFNAGLLAQQEAARQGVSSQNSASAAQTGVGILSAVASGASALSDERKKKNITDGNEKIGKFLDSYNSEKVTQSKKPTGPSPGGVESDPEPAAKKSPGQAAAGAVGQALGAVSSGFERAASNREVADRALSGIEGMTESARSRTTALSDKKEKKNVKDGDDDVGAFLDSLNAKEYEYKDPDMPGAGHGRRVGIMAQDMEKTPMGKSAVIERDGTKMIDLNKSVSAALAGLANINKRLKDLEHA